MKKLKLIILGVLLIPTLAFASNITADSFYSADPIAGLSAQQVNIVPIVYKGDGDTMKSYPGMMNQVGYIPEP